MAVKEYYQPQSLDEAVDLLDKHGPSLLVMAGGTLAMPLINDGVSQPELVMGLRQTGLNTITHNGNVTIGACTTLTHLLNQSPIRMLREAAKAIGGWAIRNMGTVGGNLFAPPPGGDLAAALLALDAEVTLARKGGKRTLPLRDFYTGFMTTALEPGELLTEVSVPAPAGRTAYIKLGRRQDNTPAVVTVAAHLTFDGDSVETARLVLGAAGPHPLRATSAEQALVGHSLTENSIAAAAEAAMADCEPFTDSVASEWYRRRMVGVFVQRALAQIAGLED